MRKPRFPIWGLGVQEPVPGWGLMLQGGAEEYASSAPWIAIFPGVAIVLSVLGINLFGDALRDTLDLKLRKEVTDDRPCAFQQLGMVGGDYLAGKAFLPCGVARIGIPVACLLHPGAHAGVHFSVH